LKVSFIFAKQRREHMGSSVAYTLHAIFGNVFLSILVSHSTFSNLYRLWSYRNTSRLSCRTNELAQAASEKTV